jgi:hypothetical protein
MHKPWRTYEPQNDRNRTEGAQVEFEAANWSNERSEALHYCGRIVPKQRLSNFFNCEVDVVRKFLLAIVAVAAMMDVTTASASWTIAPPGSEKSKEIAQMNILDRPNRMLHFYGDAVRLANRRREAK